jgi:hypothetical protein
MKIDQELQDVPLVYVFTCVGTLWTDLMLLCKGDRVLKGVLWLQISDTNIYTSVHLTGIFGKRNYI